MATIVISCAACGGKNRIPDTKQHLHPKCGKCKAPLVVDSFVVPVELFDANMDSFVKSASLPVLVDFFSPTCGPCKTLAPLLRNLAKKFHHKIIIATVDTSTNPGCSAFYKIRGVPTLIFFKNGTVVDQIVGLPEPAMLESKLVYFAKK
ncbi:co-chaperone YbbN [Desulforhopalus sp. IMCC35007]|uniref:thioredoxin family protein n=1 Tax=Desulforhopalus sp. IMCC35007 TaxID=2569543 RepID=UPI0010AE278A|nr:thioredoxin domain-containing protein [Desulforhopalus sp. IMCC35007]TKB09133.1 thiol reductase thioredoxin [Desulforhopalus sp. IMCC35007]